jgi:hypothetical protein
MKLGFTGTSHCPLTIRQRILFRNLICRLRPTEFHHGDCIHADAEAHEIVRVELPDCAIHIHPPINPGKRAFLIGDKVYPKKEYRIRNIDIIQQSDELAATPKAMLEERRSGTWMTIRLARKAKKKIHMLWPLLRKQKV